MIAKKTKKKRPRWLIWHHLLPWLAPKRLLWSRWWKSFCIFFFWLSFWHYNFNPTVLSTWFILLEAERGSFVSYKKLKNILAERRRWWWKSEQRAWWVGSGSGRQQEVRSCRFLLMSFQKQCGYCRTPFHFPSVSPWAEMRVGFKLSIAPRQSPLGPRKHAHTNATVESVI